MAASPRDRGLAARPGGADRVGQDGRRDPGMGRTPVAEPGRHATPTCVVPAHADARRPDGRSRRELVRQAGLPGQRQRPSAGIGRRPRAHGRRRRGRLARDPGEPGGARRHTGHAVEPGADARLRLIPRHLADGVRPSARGRPVGVRRSAAHGRGTGDLRPARSVPAVRGDSRRAGRPPGGNAGPQPVDLGHARSAVARHRRSSHPARRDGDPGRSGRGTGRKARASGARGQESRSFAGGADFPEESRPRRLHRPARRRDPRPSSALTSKGG